MGLRDDLLPDVDDIRSIPGEEGLHLFRVFVRVQTWSGGRPHLGTKTGDVQTELLVGGRPPHVREIRSRDIAAGTSELKSVEWEIGPLTQAWAGGGVPPELIDPDRGATAGSIQFVLFGPGLPATGLVCHRVTDSLDKPFRVMVRVRSSGRQKV